MNELGQNIGIAAILLSSAINALVFALTENKTTRFLAIWVLLVGIYLEVAV
jgi:hypothetical protein